MLPFRVDGRLALVTGATRGIGRGVANALAQSGASLILVGREKQELESFAEELRSQGISAQACPFDLAETREIEAWLNKICDRIGVPDILVNSAGVTRRGMAVDLSLDDFEQVMRVNTTAIFELSRGVARRLIEAGRSGRIVNIASLMTAAARPGTSPYTSSKGAVGQLTKALAVEWAKHGILVNAIAPGYIATDLNQQLIADPEFDSWVKTRCPLGRWGTPEDIAWSVVFLASDAASFITGQTIFVDGGWLATF